MPRISDFAGLVTDADPGDLPPGTAQSAVNVSTTTAGKLKVRGGIQPVTFTSTSTISSSSFHTFRRLAFCKTRQGDLIGVNGIDRGFRWDGITTNIEQLGITAPAAAPTISAANLNTADKGKALTTPYVEDNGSGLYQITSSAHGLSDGDTVRLGNIVGTGSMQNDLNGQEFTVANKSTNKFDLAGTNFDGGHTSGGTWSQEGYGGTAGKYTFAYRYIDNTSTAVPSSLSGVTEVTANENDFFAWSGLSTTTETRAQFKLELWRSTSGVSNVLFKVATIAYGSIGSGFADEVDDASLNVSSADDTILILANPPTDLSLIGRRFEPPPTDRPVVVQFQDRYFYLGQVKYNRGTVTTDGDETIVGSSTDWVSTMVGRYIEIDGESAPLEISAFTDATHLTLSSAAATSASGKSYIIVPEQSRRRAVDFSEIDEPESIPVVNIINIQEVQGDDDDIIAAMPFGPNLFFMGERHKYGLSFSRDPLLDGSIRYVEDRGVFNQECWDVFENSAYMMDDMGPYVFTGSARPIGMQIHDLWRRDGSGEKIDFSKKDAFFVKVDRAKDRAYFFVAFQGDSQTLPTRALVYNIRRQTWDNYHYPQEIGSAAIVQSSGQTRMILGAEGGTVHLADQGNTDIITAEVTGTATGSSGTTLTDSGASFAAGVVGASVYIYEGTGKGQRRTITARTGTQLTVATWTTNPDTTSKYVVGAIEWNWKSSSFGFIQDDQRQRREIAIKFKPTTGDQRLDVRFYYNNDTTATAHEMSQKLGDAVEIQETNKEDAVFFMKSARSGLEDSSGHEKFRFDGMYSQTSHGDHKVAVELRGYAADDVPEIQSIDISGVEG